MEIFRENPRLIETIEEGRLAGVMPEWPACGQLWSWSSDIQQIREGQIEFTMKIPVAVLKQNSEIVVVSWKKEEKNKRENTSSAHSDGRVR